MVRMPVCLSLTEFGFLPGRVAQAARLFFLCQMGGTLPRGSIFRPYDIDGLLTLCPTDMFPCRRRFKCADVWPISGRL